MNAIRRFEDRTIGTACERAGHTQETCSGRAVTPARAVVWTVRFICCGREDGEQTFATWAEANQAREQYTSGTGVHPNGYSAHATEPGHKRAAIVYRAGS